MSRPAFEVADVFRRFGETYRSTHQLPTRQHRMMRAIEACRTASLGGHVDECGNCRKERISYNSCRNRHCPKCQNGARARWVERRRAELLPAPYFHVVFTIPSELNGLALRNKEQIYNILFDASAETLLTIAADKRHLGARVGFFSILHTWGQNLLLHPHVHCVVTGGGLSGDGRWVSCRPGFFLSVRVLSRLFRRLFLTRLRAAAAHARTCPDDMSFAGPDEPEGLLRRIEDKEWVVYAKPPFGGPAQVIEYLGRYTHRVALSNDRIIDIDDEAVSFRYKNYRSANSKQKWRTMRVPGAEFIGRFLLHTLPPGFARIRHYGLLASRNKGRLLPLCRELIMADTVLPSTEETAPFTTDSELAAFRCPECGHGPMRIVSRFLRSPPPRFQSDTS